MDYKLEIIGNDIADEAEWKIMRLSSDDQIQVLDYAIECLENMKFDLKQEKKIKIVEGMERKSSNPPNLSNQRPPKPGGSCTSQEIS